MDSINLLNPHEPQEFSSPPPRRRRGRLFVGVLIAIFVIGGTLVTANVVLPSIRLSQSFGSDGFLKQLTHLTFSRDRVLAGEGQDRINMLLIGIGGAGHDGALLADSLIVASLQPSTGKAALLSLPRDLLAPATNGGWRKVNEAYARAEAARPGTGGDAATKIVGNLLGQQIPYFVRVDFGGFEELVESVGGINVYVDRPFTDPLFPSATKRFVENEEGELVEIPNYDPVTFAGGWQHMDGETALRFARSRHGNNGEGSDFARSARQQKILLALKDRVLTRDVLLNPLSINRLTAELADSLETNVEPWEVVRLYELAREVNSEEVVRVTLNAEPQGLLVPDITTDGAYVLRPRTGHFDELYTLARDIFDDPELIQEPARVAVLNGTTIGGLAAATADRLARLGYRVVHIGNASEPNDGPIRIFDHSGGQRPTSLGTLRLMLSAESSPVIPDWLLESAQTFDPRAEKYARPVSTPGNPDFVIVLGAEAPAGRVAGQNTELP